MNPRASCAQLSPALPGVLRQTISSARSICMPADIGESIPLLQAAYQIDPANRGNEYDLALAYKETGDFRSGA